MYLRSDERESYVSTEKSAIHGFKLGYSLNYTKPFSNVTINEATRVTSHMDRDHAVRDSLFATGIFPSPRRMYPSMRSSDIGYSKLKIHVVFDTIAAIVSNMQLVYRCIEHQRVTAGNAHRGGEHIRGGVEVDVVSSQDRSNLQKVGLGFAGRSAG